MSQRALPWSNEVSKRIGNPLLRDVCESNPPSHVAQFHPWDERQQVQNQFLLETKRDQVLHLGVDDLVSLLQLRDVGTDRVLLVMAMPFRRFVATLDSSRNHANKRPRCASICRQVCIWWMGYGGRDISLPTPLFHHDLNCHR